MKRFCLALVALTLALPAFANPAQALVRVSCPIVVQPQPIFQRPVYAQQFRQVRYVQTIFAQQQYVAPLAIQSYCAPQQLVQPYCDSQQLVAPVQDYCQGAQQLQFLQQPYAQTQFLQSGYGYGQPTERQPIRPRSREPRPATSARARF